jgi:hypothetical protein
MTSSMRCVVGSLAIVVAAVVAACGGSGNAFKDSYRSSLERWPSGEVSRLLPSSGKVEIVTSKDIEADAIRMMESGYLLLGRSKFKGEQVNPDAAREVAGDLNASVVLLKTEYANTVQEAIPIEKWTNIRRESAERTSGARAGGPSSAMHGEFRITYVRKAVDYYNLAATFWAKSKPPIFGVLVETQGARTSESGGSGPSSTGRGVVVRAVIMDSPAARAGVLRDDVVVRFAGTEIVDPDQFFDTVVANKGREVEIELVRVADSKVIKLQLQLRNE